MRRVGFFLIGFVALLLSYFYFVLPNLQYRNLVVLSKQSSPNGKTDAYLVRMIDRGTKSDVFYIAFQSPKETKPPLAGLGYYSYEPLYVTNGSNLEIAWNSNDVLMVLCKHCGLRPIDIMRAAPSWKNIAIKYVGLPSDDYVTCEPKKNCFDPS